MTADAKIGRDVSRIATHTWVLALLAVVSFLMMTAAVIVLAVYVHKLDDRLANATVVADAETASYAACLRNPERDAADC